MCDREYIDKAIQYCEKYGIVEFRVAGGKLIYYANYPDYLSQKRVTYKVTVNLDTMEESRVELKRFNKVGNANMYK